MVLRLSLAESLFMDLSPGDEDDDDDDDDEPASFGLLEAADVLLAVVLLTLATFVPCETTEGQHW